MVSLSLDPVRPARGGIGLVGAGMSELGGASEAGSNRVAGVRAKEYPRYVLRGLIQRIHAASSRSGCFLYSPAGLSTGWDLLCVGWGLLIYFLRVKL